MPNLLKYEKGDYLNEWEYEMIDSGAFSGPFYGESRTQIQDVNGDPELFFQ